MKDEEQKCKSCRYWGIAQPWRDARLCQRFPPQVFGFRQHIETPTEYVLQSWPETFEDERCGEWVKR